MSSKKLGTLVVVVLKARHLKDSHTFYKQDPYAVIQLGNTKHQTKVEPKGGQHPVWDDEFRIDIYNQSFISDSKLKIAVYSKEYKDDALIGQAEVDISETLKKGEFDEWVPLELDKSFKGEVYLELTYYAAEPPLVRRPSKLPPIDRLSRPPVTPPKERTSPYLYPQKASVTSSGHLTVPDQPSTSSGFVAPPSHPSHAVHSPYELPPSLRVPKIQPSNQSSPSHISISKPTPSSDDVIHQSLPIFHFPEPDSTQSDFTPVTLDPSLSRPLTPQSTSKFQDPTLKNIPFLNVGPASKSELSSPKPLQHVPSVLRPTNVKSSPIPVQSRIPPQLPPKRQNPQELFRLQLEESDAQFAAKLAESEGLDLERLRMEEEDAELARRLAAEGDDNDIVPGAWR